MTKALEAPELLADPKFESYQSRTVNVGLARQEIQKRIGLLTRSQAIKRLEQADVPCGPVRTVAEVTEDTHFANRGSLQSLKHGTLSHPVKGIASGFPVLFSAGKLPELEGAPTLGMHNREIYGKLLGLRDDRLEELAKRGII